jgi:hypothetical protein
LTWAGIGCCAIALAGGIALGLLVASGPLGFVALGLAVGGAIQLLRGLIRMLWLSLGGADQPLRSYLRRRLDG